MEDEQPTDHTLANHGTLPDSFTPPANPPAEVDNPEDNEDNAKNIGKYAENCKIDYNLRQLNSGTTFDNMMITDDPAEAGKFELTADEFYEDTKLDQGAQTSQDTSNTAKPMLIQFTMKQEQNIDCCGNYIKLFHYKLDQAAMPGRQAPTFAALAPRRSTSSLSTGERTTSSRRTSAARTTPTPISTR